MPASIFLVFYSNGDVWISNNIAYVPGTTTEASNNRGTEAGTVVKAFQINPDCTPQKITTLTGSGNSSASALAASGGSTTKSFGKLVELT